MIRIAFLIAMQVMVAHGSRVPKPGFIALRVEASDGRPKPSESAADCDLACGDEAPKKCVPDCHAALYECINEVSVGNTKESQRCKKKILEGIKHVRTFMMNIPTESVKTTTTTTTNGFGRERNATHVIAAQHNANQTTVDATVQTNTTRGAVASNKTNKTTTNATGHAAMSPYEIKVECQGICTTSYTKGQADDEFINKTYHGYCTKDCTEEFSGCLHHHPEDECRGHMKEKYGQP